jgi:hypothetical protein
MTKTLLTNKLYLNSKSIVKGYIWNTALYGAETRTLRKVGQIFPEIFAICWRKDEKISWADRGKK